MLLAIKEKENRRETEKIEPNLDYARYLLTQTHQPLGQIACACGWRSERDFNEYFQPEIGVTPAHYRRWHQS